MAVGSLKLYDRLVNSNGIIQRIVDLPSVRLGGLNSPTEYSLIAEAPVEASPLRAYLEVGLISREPRLSKWRLWLNSIAITREFKPSFIVPVEDGVYAKAVYDLKPVMSSQKSPYNVIIQYNGSPEIELADIVLTSIYPDNDSWVTYSSLSGALVLEPGERYDAAIPLDTERLNVSIVTRLPNKLARLVIRCGEHSREVGGYVGWREVSVECEGGEKLVVEYPKLDRPYFPRKVIVASIFASWEVRKEPAFSITAVRTSDGVDVSISNNGLAAPETLLLLVFSRGVVVERRELPPLKPGSTYRVVLGGKGSAVTLRLVWRYKGRTGMIEYKVK